MEGPYLSVMSLIVTEVEMVRQSFNLSWKSGSSQVRNQNEITVDSTTCRKALESVLEVTDTLPQPYI